MDFNLLIKELNSINEDNRIKEYNKRIEDLYQQKYEIIDFLSNYTKDDNFDLYSVSKYPHIIKAHLFTKNKYVDELINKAIDDLEGIKLGILFIEFLKTECKKSDDNKKEYSFYNY